MTRSGHRTMPSGTSAQVPEPDDLSSRAALIRPVPDFGASGLPISVLSHEKDRIVAAATRQADQAFRVLARGVAIVNCQSEGVCLLGAVRIAA